MELGKEQQIGSKLGKENVKAVYCHPAYLTYMQSTSSRMQRHHFAGKDPFSQTMVFPVVMYLCEGWTIKKVECQRTDAFEL